ncbi:MAG: choice-of-anchor D domain-containing protein [Candidatus Kapaibacteriales bacterium]
MKKLSFLFTLFFFGGIVVYSQKITAEQMLFNSSQGKEFWIAIPPNEDDRQPYGNTGEIAIEIYVTSSKNTMCTVEVPGLKLIRSKKVEAFKITTFSTLTNDLQWALEVRQSEQPIPLGIHVYADQPISVYVLNHRGYTADGYLAIPISSCGTEYIHLSYYDFYENNAGGEYRGGGFIITAAENGTEVFLELKGKGKEIGQTLGGHRIGDRWKVTLNQGEVYCVMGNGATRGEFDISGSRVVSNKPIGFISFHKRTLIPSFDLWNGRNMLCEMIPPVSAWGKKYATVEFMRKGRGDFFRIIAARDNTTFTVKWYDLKDGRFLGQRGPMLLKKAGDFAEFEEVYVPRNTTNTLESIKGTSIWEADKPVLVMQYSYSTDWDNAPEFDPFMILVIPQEQYVTATVFQTPEAQAQFLTNYFNIIAIGDTTDPSAEKLKSLTLDGKPIWQLEPTFIFNQIPGTDLFWAKLRVQPGAHVVKGNTKFGGYIYGFSEADGYGWPAATAFNKVDETDTLPPEIFVAGNCGVFTIRTTELRNGKPDDNPRQIDQGVYDINLLEGTENFEIKFINEFKTYPPLYNYTFIVQVINKRKPGVAYLAITDRAGNTSFDTLSYAPDSITVLPPIINFRNVRLFTTKQLEAQVINSSDSTTKIKAIFLQSGTYFSITSGNVPPEIELPSNFPFSVTIAYSPNRESTNPNMLDVDSLVVITECDTFKFPVVGRGVVPKILVEDWNAGSVVVGKKVCKNQQTMRGLLIQNVGSDTLIIDAIDGVIAPFSLSDPYTPSLNFVIPPNESIYLETPCFEPTAVDNYSIDVTFHTNGALGIDSISTWRGSGIKPGPYITSYDWNRRRVGTSNEGKVYLRNSGTSKVRVTDINLSNLATQFRIKPDGIIPQPTPSSPIDLMPENSGSGTTEIEVTVIYEPDTEFQHHNLIIPVFHPDDLIEPGSVIGTLDGFGYLPKIEITGYEFQPPVLVGTQHPDIGKVVIKSLSQSADLFIRSIDWQNNNLNEFIWQQPPPTNFILRMGDSLVLPVLFTPKAVNRRQATVAVVNDAAPAPDSIITTTAFVIGYGIEKGITVDSINYGLVLLCDEPIREFTIRNISSTTPAIIDSVVLISGDINNFEIINTTFPITIPQMEEIKINVRFSPTRTGNYSALARVYSDFGSEYFVLLEAIGYNVPVQFTLQDFGNNTQLAPGMPIDFPINLSSNNWNDANITSFKFDLVFKSDWLNLISYEKGNLLDNTWNLNAQIQPIDDTYSKIYFEGSGSNPIRSSGTLIRARLGLLLSDYKQYQPYLDNISFDARDRCVVPIADTSTIVLNACVLDLRPILVANSKFYLSVPQNPIQSNDAIIQFGIAWDGTAVLELTNLLGDVVQTFVAGNIKAGDYTLNVDATNIPNNLYYLRLITNGFSQVVPIVIAK